MYVRAESGNSEEHSGRGCNGIPHRTGKRFQNGNSHTYPGTATVIVNYGNSHQGLPTAVHQEDHPHTSHWVIPEQRSQHSVDHNPAFEAGPLRCYLPARYRTFTRKEVSQAGPSVWTRKARRGFTRLRFGITRRGWDFSGWLHSGRQARGVALQFTSQLLRAVQLRAEAHRESFIAAALLALLRVRGIMQRLQGVGKLPNGPGTL